MRRNTQISLPRTLIRNLGADCDDDASMERLFGKPPQVWFQLYGDPPRAIVVWPLANEAFALERVPGTTGKRDAAPFFKTKEGVTPKA